MLGYELVERLGDGQSFIFAKNAAKIHASPPANA